MAGIGLFGGTVEGRALAELFAGSGVDVHVCVTTEYGASLIPQAENLHVCVGRMNREEIEAFLAERDISLCLDATHPYAAEVTKNIAEACAGLRVERMRILRKEDGREMGIHVESVEEAVAYLERTEGNILITTGSKELKKYTALTDYKKRCFARVLSTAEVAASCRDMGFEGSNLICMQGPFSEELNYAMLKQINASWLVTKSSGPAGGFEEKCQAAVRAGVGIIIIGRPLEEKVSENGNATESVKRDATETVAAPGVTLDLEEAEAFLCKRFGLLGKTAKNGSGIPDDGMEGQKKREIFFIGAGVGNPLMMTVQAKECLKKCDAVIGAKRILDICPKGEDQMIYESYKGEEIAAFLKNHPEIKKAAVVFSGDIGFYSAAHHMENDLKDFVIHRISGIASPIYFLDKLGIAWEDVKFASCHGKQVSLPALLKDYDKVCVLLGKPEDVSNICKELIQAGMEQVRIKVGERLSYAEERIVEGTAKELAEAKFDPLAVALFENLSLNDERRFPGIPDESFIRGKVPMTKEEIRILSLSKLKMKKDMVLYDIGAGTGSISVEAALQFGESRIYAIEKNPEGIGLIRDNIKRFKVTNIGIVEGEAPKALKELEPPTHVFIGGSGSRMFDIIKEVRAKNPKARFVVNSITLETMAVMEQIIRQYPEYDNMEILQVGIAKGKKVGEHHMMMGQNPIYIFSFGGE